MSLIRIVVSALFLSVMASHASAAEGQLKLAQAGSSQDALVIACQGKPVGATCSFTTELGDKISGTCREISSNPFGNNTSSPTMCMPGNS